MRLFKLLEDSNGGVCSNTECHFKHKNIIGSNYTLTLGAETHTSYFSKEASLWTHWAAPSKPCFGPQSCSLSPLLRCNTCPKDARTGFALGCSMYLKMGRWNGRQRHHTQTWHMLGLYDKGLVFTNISHTSLFLASCRAGITPAPARPFLWVVFVFF